MLLPPSLGESMPPSSPKMPENLMLRGLMSSDLERLQPYLIDIDMPVRMSLSRPDRPIDYAYFLGTGVVSLVQPLDDGSSVEAGLIGREGFFGVHAILGAESAPSEAMVQLSGRGWRLPLSVLRAEMEYNQSFRRQALLFAQALSVQITFSVACNARHSVNHRLARWLSAARDRIDGDTLAISQEFLAMMLGCRRSGVTDAIAVLRAANLINGSAGRITILDREGLRSAACSCYGAIKAEYQKLLS